MLEMTSISPTLAAVADTALNVGSAPAWVLAIPMLPLLAVVLNTFGAIFRVKTKLPAWITIACLAGSFLTTALAFMALSGQTNVVTAWKWFDLSWGTGQGQQFIADFGFYIDNLTLLWMLFVTGLATLIAVYASEYMEHDVGKGYTRFFVAFGLFRKKLGSLPRQATTLGPLLDPLLDPLLPDERGDVRRTTVG